MASAAERVYDLIKETVEAQGVTLWDVRFLKEGASWYLRVFIDKQGGINIDDCTNVSHAIDPIIDEANPIDKSFYQYPSMAYGGINDIFAPAVSTVSLPAPHILKQCWVKPLR